jgi:hypothetical protein
VTNQYLIFADSIGIALMMLVGYFFRGRPGALRAGAAVTAVGAAVILIPFTYNFVLTVQALESTRNIFDQTQVLYSLLSPGFFTSLGSFALGEYVGLRLARIL